MHSLLNSRLLTYALLAGGLLSACSKNTPAATDTPGEVPVDQVTVTLKHALPAVLTESSGLCYTDGALWSFGDSGNPNSIYKIDSATGTLLQTVTITNYPNTDWEDMTADSVYIYIGDTGNNDGFRTDLKILRIRKADIPAGSDQASVTAEAIRFSYTDQLSFSYNSNTNFDCEALVALDSSLYLFTKNRGDFQTRCYQLPKDTGTYAVAPISTFNTGGKITDATYNSSTKELALLGYMNQQANSFIWFFNGFKDDQFFADSSSRITIGSAAGDWQTEGLVYISASRLLMTCESTTTNAASLYAVQKN